MLSPPVEGTYRISGEFGQIPNYPLNNGFHKGIDVVSENKRLVLPHNAHVQALPNNGPDGNAQYITFKYQGKDVRIAICHMASFAVTSGDYPAGTYLGLMGNTGAASGVHAHIAVRINGELVNPRTLFNFEEEDMAKPTKQQVISQFRTFEAGTPTEKQIKDYTNADWGKLNGDLLQFVYDRLKEARAGKSATGATPRQLAAEKAVDALKEALK